MIHNQQIKDVLQGKKFVITGKESEEYGEYTQKTAKLLKKPFYVIHAIFEREQWPLSKIKERYHQAEKVEGMPKDVFWWWKKKQDKPVDNLLDNNP